MTLNISGTLNKALVSSRRRKLTDDVLNEILSWNPREFVTAFRRWHHGSVSLIHLNVLTIIDTDGPESMSHLADALEVSVASMTGIIQRMEKRGLVERRHGGEDRRVVRVHPTEAGNDVFRTIERRRREALAKLFERLSEEDLAALLKGHRALRAARAAVTARAEARVRHVTAARLTEAARPVETGTPAVAAQPTDAAQPTEEANR